MRDELTFLATRNITIGDFTELLRLLNQRGYNVQALDRQARIIIWSTKQFIFSKNKIYTIKCFYYYFILCNNS